jgi:hypothetical protein
MQQQQQQPVGYPNPPPPLIVTQQPSDESFYKNSAPPPPAVQEHNPLPTDPPFVAQRKQIEQQLGSTCPKGGFHELRMHYTNETLCFAFLILPYFCGYRGRREVCHL